MKTKPNYYYEVLAEFLKDMKLCTFSRRVNTDCDNYTLISRLGKSVVDYILVPHDTLPNCFDFKVYSVTDIMSFFNVSQFESDFFLQYSSWIFIMLLS